MATSTDAAEKAAGLKEVGGLARCEPAWRGDGGPEDKQRLKGSIVMLKSGKYAYLPVSSSSSVVKVFNTRDGDAGRVIKVKISAEGRQLGIRHVPHG